MATPGRRAPESSAPTLRLRRWWRRTTHGVTAAAVVLVVAPAVPVGGGPGSVDPGPRSADAATATSPHTPVLEPDLRLVGHRKPHPHRTIKRYRVRPGDTPSGIAVRFHAWTAQLLRINHTRTLYAGEVILVPVVTRVARECKKHKHHRTNVRGHAKRPPVDKRAKASKPAKQQRKPAGQKGPKKKPAKVAPARKPKAKQPQAPHSVRHAHGWHHRGFSRAEVRRVIVAKAKRHDVNPALALAVAWQESGWQHDRVSSAGAIGAMQIMPGTGRWMSALTGRRLNIRDLYDNVTAGVVLLRLLRDQAGPRVAVAGYYQGLAGVRRYGMYRSTKRYVDNVHALRKRIERGGSPL